MNLLFSSIFSGSYIFNRHVSPHKIDMRGNASFRSHSPHLKHYHEKGSYIWEKNEQEFYQNQWFVIHGSQLSIFKGAGDRLHTFNLTEKSDFPIHLNHIHQCKNDQYTLDFCIQSHDKLSTFYRILGPNKDYAITTNFSRVDQRSCSGGRQLNNNCKL